MAPRTTIVLLVTLAGFFGTAGRDFVLPRLSGRLLASSSVYNSFEPSAVPRGFEFWTISLSAEAILASRVSKFGRPVLRWSTAFANTIALIRGTASGARLLSNVH